MSAADDEIAPLPSGLEEARSAFVALCGGVGGAKLASGLQHHLQDRLSLIVNVGDDFDHLGLRICPDIDTVLYTLSSLNDQFRGWGRARETWNFMHALGQFGGDTWFQLGDLDLALHVVRTHRLGSGETLSAITADIAASLSIPARIIPATDDRLRTKVVTPGQTLDFQRYFVEQQCRPRVEALRFEGADRATVSTGAESSFADDTLAGIVICPSNPYLSVDPILAIPRLRQLLRDRSVPAVAVSPIIGGKAIKGPTTKIMQELGVACTAASIAKHYEGLVDGLIIDEADAEEAEGTSLPTLVTKTLMVDPRSRNELASRTLEFIQRLGGARRIGPQ
ncbi:2-phospho-L-lactate transferase [Methylobacterium sp. NEAU 140]|uniref:2-phospho-L-lactate transferase n=1 Tax=Methylobacterium sp. NEAU 140 TaxID=3064945 RepID=UPI002732F3E6|nr:2-phospho-L-lactate transferase [Methylobacterium sp. NEAU 140]MDP4026599.1 2-phospho-L-lactate transferase [Methylobacterium sp. NEAU 140]